MANNPFTHLTDMQGQEFVSAQTVRASLAGRDTGAESAIDDPVFDPDVSPNRLNRTSNLGKVTVVDTSYTAGYEETGASESTHHFASYGSIQFANLKDSNGTPITLYIHGFSSNGMFLSTERDEYRSISAKEWKGTPYILGFNGVIAQDDGSNTGKTITGSGGGDKFYEDPSVLTTALCFAEGTRLATPAGPVAIEALRVGDTVLTAAGRARPVRWIGQMTVRPAWHPWPRNVRPVRIAAHAFAPGCPARDLRLSPGHAVAVDGVLVPAIHLVNDATIVQEEVAQVRYYHVELDDHDVLLAEGLPCESYFDDGNRATFTQGAGLPAGRIDPAGWDHACAPIVTDGPQMLAIRRRLHALAEALGWVRSEETGLHIETADDIIAPHRHAGHRYRCVVPKGGTVTVRSRHAVLAHTMLGMDDHRRLGVALTAIWVDGTPLALTDPALGAGFHPVETRGAASWRWTDGAAQLALPAVRPVTLDFDLLMVAPNWHHPEPEARDAA